jgi:prepilin-type N-terminal cleavage/methylation domain-containing protein
MTSRPAFTLLELIVSIAVAGLIALLVYGSASAGFDTRDALARYRSTSESELTARVMITDALRHATDEADTGAAAFGLVDATDARGLPTDQLSFLTRGILPPLGASAVWTMTLAPSARGLLLRATPTSSAGDRQGTGSITAVLGEIRGLDVRVMSLVDRAWSASWPSSRQLPAAVEITFYDATGAPVGAPVVVRLGLEAVQR